MKVNLKLSIYSILNNKILSIINILINSIIFSSALIFSIISFSVLRVNSDSFLMIFVYILLMFLLWAILATDISLRMLSIAKKGIYSFEKIKNLPPELIKKYFLKGINKEQGNVKIKPELQLKITYRYHNLLDNNNEPDFRSYDIIFCRNVLIYFNKDVQLKVLIKLCNYLKKGGILFIGHSESLTGMPLPLKHLQPTIYMKI